MTGHARLPPSGADWWMQCPGGPNFVANIPEERTSRFAAEGTVAHQVRSDSLTLGLDPDDFVGQKITADGFTFEVTDEMATFLQPGIDRCREMEGKTFVEHRVDLRKWLPGQFGTLDFGAAAPRTIRVNDLKFGAGIPVSPIENRQLKLYALGFWDNIAREISNAKNFELSIDQPRVDGGGGSWTIRLDDLLAFGEEVKAAGKATEDPDAPRIAGAKQCYWCRGKDFCKEYAAFNLALVGQKFDDLDENIPLAAPPALPKALTPEQRSYVLIYSKMLTAWLDRLHADCLADALAGRPTPDMKAVLGRMGDREWSDAERAEAILIALFADDAFTKKLISPAQVEKKLGKKVMAANKKITKLITQNEAKPSLVPNTDSRPAIVPLNERFEDLT